MATYLPGVTDFIPDIQPYQPDWESIDKTMRLKQGQYDQNYASLQGTYSGLLNMPQLKQDQIDKRDKFLKQAFKNLGDLATVDLSLPENVAAANNVFAPLYNDTEFLGNSSLSKHYQQQEQYADSLRQKDSGKDFNTANLNYVLKQKNEYIRDQSPEAWKKYYSQKRFYEPYYNANQEVRDAMEKFKPSQVAYTKMNGMYFVKTDDKSWREDDIKRYLNGVLSDKAKRQMQIEADVYLGDNNTIIGMYKSSAEKDMQFNNSKIEQINTGIKNSKSPQEVSDLQDLKIQYAHANEELKSRVDKINRGDVDFITNNRESLAYEMYYNNVVDKTAKAYAHKDIKEDITENSVAFGMWKDGQEWGRLRFREANANARHAAGLAAKKKEDEDKTSSPILTQIPSGPADKVDPLTLEDLKTQANLAKDQVAIESETLKKHIAKLNDKPVSQVTPADLYSYINSPEGRSDLRVKRFNDVAKNAQLTIDNAENEMKQAQEYALSKMPTGYDPFSGMVRGSGTNLFANLPKLSNNFSKERLNASMQKTAFDNKRKFAELQQEYFGTTQASLRQGLTFADNDSRIKGTKQVLTSLSGVDLNKIREVTYSTRDDNRISFTVDDPKQDKKEIVKKLESKGFKAELGDDDETIIINNSQIDAGLNPFSNLNGYAKKLIGTLNSRIGANNSEYQSTYFDFPTVSKDGAKFRIDKTFDDSSSSYYLYREKNGVSKALKTAFDSPMDAYKFAEDAALNPSRADILFK